jgi:hypothetical protein
MFKVHRQQGSSMINIGFSLVILVVLPFCSVDDLPAFDAIEQGETITYDIKKFKVTMGEAQLVYNGLVKINNQSALSITVTATGFKFFDKEQIYLDPETFFPILIKRNLDIFGKKENIVEYYDVHKGKVRIVKRANGKTDQEVIEAGGRFDNIYGYIYRQRLLGRFIPHETFDLHLPTRDVQFKLMETKKIEVNDKDYKAFYIASEPKKYKMWFDSGPRKSPLKIDGVIGWGKMSMVIQDQGP